MTIRFNIYRFNPETDSKPFMQAFSLDVGAQVAGLMVLDALLKLREQDESLTFRSSCREGVCGTDGMNINGVNALACITPLESLKQPIELRPLPGYPVVRDLIVDMEPFYHQYRAVKPWLVANEEPQPESERLQHPEQRTALDGLYECVLCGCCTSACPSWWSNPERFLGPAALLQAARFIEDSRDQATEERLEQLDDAYKLFRCHGIMSCVDVCPKRLNPTRAIVTIKQRMLRHKI